MYKTDDHALLPSVFPAKIANPQTWSRLESPYQLPTSETWYKTLKCNLKFISNWYISNYTTINVAELIKKGTKNSQKQQ